MCHFAMGLTHCHKTTVFFYINSDTKCHSVKSTYGAAFCYDSAYM